MLGILGGMGPMATVDFMAKVIRNTPATCDQDHIRTLICSDTVIPDRTAAILHDGPDPLPSMQQALHWLESGGASVIAIPCNTAHYWYAALQAQTSVPILHIADTVARHVANTSRHCGPIGVLATTGTVLAGIYQDRLARYGLACTVPDEIAQKAVMQAIRFMKAGNLAAAATILEHEANKLLDAGCASIVMACTEIPIALAGCDAGLASRLIDPTDTLAQASVAVCLKQMVPS